MCVCSVCAHVVVCVCVCVLCGAVECELLARPGLLHALTH